MALFLLLLLLCAAPAARGGTITMTFEGGVYTSQRMTLLPASDTGSYGANTYQPYVEGVGTVQAWLTAQ